MGTYSGAIPAFEYDPTRMRRVRSQTCLSPTSTCGNLRSSTVESLEKALMNIMEASTIELPPTKKGTTVQRQCLRLGDIQPKKHGLGEPAPRCCPLRQGLLLHCQCALQLPYRWKFLKNSSTSQDRTRNHQLHRLCWFQSTPL